jgi:UDP-N-acetylglucosamine 2-epimerase
MKKILFPITNRVHKARQQLLLNELKNDFIVDEIEYPTKYDYILNNVADIANHFRKVLGRNEYDLILCRGDRYEILPIAMLAAYKGLKIAHIEGGDLSGAVDNKVRYALTALSDLHFATNKESYKRLISMGTDPEWTFDFGSLDCEYAKSVKIDYMGLPYVLMCHHSMPGENAELIEKIIREEWQGQVIVIKSNKEEYDPKTYINLLAKAECLVGNSSSFLKEASIFGTPVVNIGSRQVNRLKSDNVKDVPFDEGQIREMIKFQLKAKYDPSNVYYKPNTSKSIVEEIKRFLECNHF